MFSAILCQKVEAPPLWEVFDSSITGVPYLIGKRKPPDLLERFCRIGEAEDAATLAAAVVRFAKRWGLLGLCEHGLPNAGCPRHHREDRSMVTERSDASGLQAASAWLWWSGRESFEHWKGLALAFRSMLQIGLNLNRGKRSKNLDWQLAAVGLSGDLGEEVLGEGWAEGISASSNTDEITRRTTKGLRLARVDYEILIQWLIDISHLHPKFQLRGRNKWDIELDSTGSAGNIPAILTSQLMIRVGSLLRQIQCSECSGWFIPRRNQRKYCDRCGIQAAWRVAQRKRRG
jgi:hypothetical protein